MQVNLPWTRHLILEKRKFTVLALRRKARESVVNEPDRAIQNIPSTSYYKNDRCVTDKHV